MRYAEVVVVAAAVVAAAAEDKDKGKDIHKVDKGMMVDLRFLDLAEEVDKGMDKENHMVDMGTVADLNFLDFVVVHLDLEKEIHKEDKDMADKENLEASDPDFGYCSNLQHYLKMAELEEEMDTDTHMEAEMDTLEETYFLVDYCYWQTYLNYCSNLGYCLNLMGKLAEMGTDIH